MDRETLSSNRKALKINLNPAIFGSFAEIGGGQEVARHFFKAGGASGTIAKTISAYDKAFSDAIYDPEASGRYVSEKRLEKMLGAEFHDLVTTLSGSSGDNKLFFSFGDKNLRPLYWKTCSHWNDKSRTITTRSRNTARINRQ